MAEHHPTEGASTSGVSNPEATLELNIKTLDSQIYSFHVDKSMRVSAFKGKIADQIGVPVGRQRLIFRGKVLKDDHLLSEYYVENGDTLHLVERQPTQPQTSSGTSSADLSGNSGTQGNDGSAGVPRNRIGQISHSVVLGTFNVGDQGEGVVPDLTRVIGAVLNSLGVGNQNASNTSNATTISQNPVPSNSSGTRGNDTEQGRDRTREQTQSSNRSQFGQSFFSQPFHAPFTGISVPPPSLNMPIPGSLNTLSEFMTSMEAVLSQNGYHQSTTGTTDHPSTDLPSNAQGLPTPEALGSVLRHAQRLLSDQAVTALSHIAGRLEQDSGSSDVSVRSQIQSESVQVGLAMQHLGAFLLELGRAILTLRMGQSPGEAIVNAGPAVYISPSGPNPIMVQPFPHQTNSLFNAATISPPNSGSLGPIGVIGNAPRHINIHIHAGTSLAPIVSAVGARAGGGDGPQGERGAAATSDPGSTRVFPVGNVIASTLPSRASIAVSPLPNTSQPPLGGSSTSQPSDAASLTSAISEVNSRIRSLLQNMRTESQTPPGHQENVSVLSSSGSDGGSAEGTEPRPSSLPDLQVQGEHNSSHVSGGLVEESDCNLKDAQNSDEDGGKTTVTRDIPIGLGGGLQPKRRTRQSMPQLKSSEGGTSSNPAQSPQARTGQQILQSLASVNASGSTSANATAPRQTVQESSPGSDDVTGMMSQLLETPALNGLLSGVAQQAGVGSPDVLRNMLQQFTQSPAMRNTVNNLVQQVDTDEMRQMLGGSSGTGQDGGFDLSRMIQQMMPIVSQVLGGNPALNEQARNAVPLQLSEIDDRGFSESSQNDLQEVVQMIAHRSPSRDIFRVVVENAAGYGEVVEAGLVNGLCTNEELANEFLEMLTRDLRHQLERYE